MSFAEKLRFYIHKIHILVLLLLSCVVDTKQRQVPANNLPNIETT